MNGFADSGGSGAAGEIAKVTRAVKCRPDAEIVGHLLEVIADQANLELVSRINARPSNRGGNRDRSGAALMDS
jgi:hypothetical protein